MDYEALEVHILPLQADQFSTSQTGESVQFCRRSKRFWQILEQCHDLVGCQDIGRPHTLRTLTYALDRVSFCPLPPNCVREQGAHQIPDFGPAPRSEEHTSELQSLRHLVCR